MTAPGDLSTEQGNIELVRKAVEELGQIDVLVSVAGKQVYVEDIADLTTEQFDQTFKTNVYGLFWLTKAALPHMPAGGSIITTSSVQAYTPSPGLLDYASPRQRSTRTPRRSRSRSPSQGDQGECCCPRAVLDAAAGQRRAAGGEDARLRRAVRTRSRRSAGRTRRGLCRILATGESSYTTGSTLSVTGGSPTP